MTIICNCVLSPPRRARDTMDRYTLKDTSSRTIVYTSTSCNQTNNRNPAPQPLTRMSRRQPHHSHIHPSRRATLTRKTKTRHHGRLPPFARHISTLSATATSPPYPQRHRETRRCRPEIRSQDDGAWTASGACTIQRRPRNPHPRPRLPIQTAAQAYGALGPL
jgi:hypothetical protein